MSFLSKFLRKSGNDLGMTSSGSFLYKKLAYLYKQNNGASHPLAWVQIYLYNLFC